MASVFTDPVLLFFVAALLGSSFLFVNGKSKDGAEGTLRMLDGSLAFTITGILASGWTWVIYNDMVRNHWVENFVLLRALCSVVQLLGTLVITTYSGCRGVLWDWLLLLHYSS